MLRPIRFSIRDSETYIDPASMRVKAGFAKVHSFADELFDKELPGTKRVALAPGLAREPIISLVDGNVTIQRIGSGPQRSVYATSISSGAGYGTIIASAIVRPDVLTPFDDSTVSSPLVFSVFPGPILPLPFSPIGSSGSSGSVPVDNGTILGLEHGPRNKVFYIRFQLHSDGTRLIRFTSYKKDDGSSPVVNSSVVFDWSSLRRYFLVWNENEGYVEVYGQVSTSTKRIFRVLISSLPDMPDSYFARAGSASEVTMLYGQLGPSGDRSTWANVAVTADAGYPVLGNIRPGDFVTAVRGAEMISVRGDRDPRDLDVSAWFQAPEAVLEEPDPDATTAIKNGCFRMTKPTAGKSFALYREEPGFLASNSDGFAVTAKIEVEMIQLVGASTGMGITIFDGQSIFQLQLFDDIGVKTIGLLKNAGDEMDITDHFLPEQAFDWKGRRTFRMVMDPRRSIIRFYDGEDMSQAISTIPFDRNNLPSASDFGLTGMTPFILVGHTMAAATRGTFVLESLSYSHFYHAWDGEDGFSPSVLQTNPAFTRTTTGGASSVMDNGQLVITNPTGGSDKFSQSAPFGANRGAIVEANVQITSWRPFSKTGTYVVLDDGVHCYAITFIETSQAKYVALSKRDALGGFRELVGRDGVAATVSFLLDWSQPHTYRIERRPYEGVKVFVDEELEPRITVAESALVELPDPLYSGTPTLAFGQFTTEAAVSKWSFVRSFFSRGYEISFKKNKPDSVLREELFDTQAMVVAHALDAD